MWPDTYAPTWTGLMNCYAQGLPFLRDSFAGNIFCVLAFAGAWYAASAVSESSIAVAASDGPQDS